jgi:hypothetical protein
VVDSPNLMPIRSLVSEREQRWARRFELPVILAAGLNWCIWLVLLAELVTLLALTPQRGRWLRQHPLELAIVVLTPPFLPSSLQTARLFRLVRLLRWRASCRSRTDSSRSTG